MTTKDTNKTLNRRELLKALAATGGAVTAATMLPGKWTKPVIEAGVLPVHAATSQFTLTAIIVNSGSNVTVTGGVPNDALIVEVQIEPDQAGVAINDEFTNGPFVGGDGPQNTNGSGIATFSYRLCENLSFSEVDDQGCVGRDFSITYSFADQSTYGSPTDSVSGSFDECDCF